VTFATPWYAFLGLVGLLPLGVAWQRLRAGDALRAELALAAPSGLRRLVRPLALAALFALLGAAAAQPAVRSQKEHAARSDAELFVVIDNSRSMLASTGPNGASRAARAVAFTRRLHAALPDVAIGIGSLTNRVLPYVFATTQDDAIRLVLSKSYGIERPPPEVTIGAEISTFDALEDVAQQEYFPRSVRKRVLVVLSDAETLPFRSRIVLSDLHLAHIAPIVVRFWRPDERVYRPDGTLERYLPNAPDELTRLRAAGWVAFDEGSLAQVLDTVVRTVGHGPISHVALERLDQPIAPYLALLALAPLLVLLAPLGLVHRPRGRTSHTSAPAVSRFRAPATPS
jgi:hypothetical protein